MSKAISKFTKVYCDYRKNLLILLFNRGKVLNLGCGNLKISGAVNLDINPEFRPEIVWDLENLPLPFKEKEFDVVFGFDIIEHVSNPKGLIVEVERVGKRSVWFCLDFDKARENWEADKTHVSYINEKIWKELFPRDKYWSFKISDALVAVKK